MAEGLLTAVSLHLPWMVPSQGCPTGAQKRMMGAGTRAECGAPCGPAIFQDLCHHICLLFLHREAQEPGLGAEFTCLRPLLLESIVSQALRRDKHHPEPERARGPCVSVNFPPGWLGFGHHEARWCNWGSSGCPQGGDSYELKGLDQVPCPPGIPFPPCNLLLFPCGEVGRVG